jgi:predicted ATPase
MLQELTLRHFKSWRNIDKMQLAPITGLFGTNSSGKTSILQWLLLMKQTFESSDRKQVLDFGDDRSYVDLGSFVETIFQHSNDNVLSTSLKFRLPKAIQIADPDSKSDVLFEGDELQFGCEIQSSKANSCMVRKMAYTFAGNEFSQAVKSDKELTKYSIRAKGKSNYKLKRVQGRAWDLPAPVKFFGFPDQVSTYFQNAGFLSDLQLAFGEQLSRLYYLGPLREYPRRQYTWGGGQPDDMGRRGEKVIEAILSSRDRGEMISRGKGKSKLSLEQYVAHWLKELGLITDFEVKPIAQGSKVFEVQVKRTAQSSPVLITDVGFGISQILPVIALCYYVPEGSTVLLEQPEIHLHPKVQSGLADVLIDAIKVRKIQVILESHSEHLLRRLQRRIAEESIQSTDTALYFCDYIKGESRLTPLDVDLIGNIRNWPKDFFGDTMTEMAETQKARLRRQSEGAA